MPVETELTQQRVRRGLVGRGSHQRSVAQANTTVVVVVGLEDRPVALEAWAEVALEVRVTDLMAPMDLVVVEEEESRTAVTVGMVLSSSDTRPLQLPQTVLR